MHHFGDALTLVFTQQAQRHLAKLNFKRLVIIKGCHGCTLSCPVLGHGAGDDRPAASPTNDVIKANTLAVVPALVEALPLLSALCLVKVGRPLGPFQPQLQRLWVATRLVMQRHANLEPCSVMLQILYGQGGHVQAQIVGRQVIQRLGVDGRLQIT